VSVRRSERHPGGDHFRSNCYRGSAANVNTSPALSIAAAIPLMRSL
jgi:hypothetical protein